MATYNLFAHIRNPYKEDTLNRSAIPVLRSSSSGPVIMKVLVQNYDTLSLAQWWAINLKRVKLDQFTFVPESRIVRFSIEEVP